MAEKVFDNDDDNDVANKTNGDSEVNSDNNDDEDDDYVGDKTKGDSDVHASFDANL